MDVFGLLALVLAPGGIIVALVERTRRQNNRDHDQSMNVLRSIDEKVDKIDDRLDHHIEWHLDRE